MLIAFTLSKGHLASNDLINPITCKTVRAYIGPFNQKFLIIRFDIILMLLLSKIDPN